MPRVRGLTREPDGTLVSVLLTGFPAGMLACNCYVLAPGAGSDAIIVDPGQRAAAPLRRILDQHRLTPAAVLLTHGHIDHIWSAQKVSDTYGCPVFIHPDDRFMLTDPIRGFGPRIGQIAMGALFREPRQVVELDRDGDTSVAGIAVRHGRHVSIRSGPAGFPPVSTVCLIRKHGASPDLEIGTSGAPIASALGVRDRIGPAEG